LGHLKVATFASGRGSNILSIIDAIKRGELSCQVVLVVSDKLDSGALKLAEENDIPAFFIDQQQFDSPDAFDLVLLNALEEAGTELIALAGYLKKIRPAIIQSYRNRILNIHPSLLPAFGGKGMYGMKVHKAVLDYGCKVTGATIHLVDDQYDSGAPLLQESVAVLAGDSHETLAQRVLKVEHALYPRALQAFAEKRIEIHGRQVCIKPANIQ